jgi:hypothetical protein
MTLEEVRQRTKALESKLVSEIRAFETDTGCLLVNKVSVSRSGPDPVGVELDITLRL